MLFGACTAAISYNTAENKSTNLRTDLLANFQYIVLVRFEWFASG